MTSTELPLTAPQGSAPVTGETLPEGLPALHGQLVAALPGSTVVVFDEDLRVLLAGGAHSPAARAAPSHLGEVIDGDAPPPIEAARDTLRTGEPLDLVLEAQDGASAHRLRITALHGFGPPGLGLAIIDGVTAQRNATRRAEGDLQALFKDATVGMCTFEPTAEGRVIAVNQALCDLLETPHDTLVGAPKRAVLPGAGSEPATAEQAALLDGGAERLEVSWTSADGTRRDAILAATMVTGGPRRRVLLHFVDISATRETERELARSLDFQTAVISSSPDVLLVHDVGTDRPVWASRSIGDAFGFDPGMAAAIDTAGLSEIVHAEDRDSHRAALLAAAAGGETVEADIRVRDGTGGWRTLEQRLTAFTHDDAGAVARVLVSSRDVTRHRQAIADLRRSNEELTQFAYVASHDLSEPLRVISGHVHLLARRYDDQFDDTAREWIGFAVDGCRRMRDLIDDLLVYSRAGNDYAPEVVSVAVPLQAATVDLSVAIAETASEVQVLGELPDVLADLGGLTTLFRNLIANAIRYRRPDHGALVQITASRHGQAWQVRVADDGIGIPEHQRERVFRIFQRLHGRETPGTGIGLAICHKIVERFSGAIWIEDTPGAAVPSSSRSRAGKMPSVSAVAHHVEVLLVEDSPGDVSLTREALKDAKVPTRLSVVEDGDAALRYLRREGEYADAPPVNVILLDLNLPKRDGREVLAELKADPELKRTPVIVLTTSAEERDVTAAYESHANAYVTKPVSYDAFVDAIRHIEAFWLRLVHLPRGG